MPENKIIWHQVARRQLGAIIEYVATDSLQNAEKIELRLKKKLNKIAQYPEMCPKDKFKTHNDGSFRAFTLFHYRVSYRIYDHEIQAGNLSISNLRPASSQGIRENRFWKMEILHC